MPRRYLFLTMHRFGRVLLLLIAMLGWHSSNAQAQMSQLLNWQELPSLPDPLGVAGPFAGVHEDALIVAGGANFPQPVWDNDKVWRDAIYVLTRSGDGWTWQSSGKLPRPLAYGATVSTPKGVLCIGGNDATKSYDDVFLLKWNAKRGEIERVEYPSLPAPCAYGSATRIGDTVFLAGGQNGSSLATATKTFWSLDLSKSDQPSEFRWKQLEPWPGLSRAFNLTVSQHNGYHQCVYVIGGRRQKSDDPQDVEFLKDVWEYTPGTKTWRRRNDAPNCLMAGTAIDSGQSHILVLGGADGSLFFQGNQLKDNHPGFPKQAWAYHTITDTWTTAGETPANHVTTVAVKWRDDIIIPSGEVRPRVRSPKLFRISTNVSQQPFGWVNYCVLSCYLLVVVGVGFYFARKNRNTDDFFRGGQNIPWWAAGCSIFATMLSSLTYTGIPSKSFAQDWVYAIGNLTIPLVAVVAVYVAMPFFRRIDATSAYEYLEKRFSRAVRLFGSASFTLFHIARMAVVMSLTGLALAVATPLTPSQSVLLMGALSIVYCTMGGIEAVIWTDTIQTFVLLGGAFLAICLLVAGLDEGVFELFSVAANYDKLTIANFHWDATSAQIALWVIIVGGIAQNLSSYTADQAVVQRYMTTADETTAARSIWTNAVLTIPATILFFGMGTALFAYYHSHPEKLDPTITTDQIFPMFIAREMPVGIAGLIVAGIFAAAQSTVSTSMNSTATTVVTDFLRPFHVCKTERGYFQAARVATFLIGVVGTLIGLMFVSPEIKSLFDEFIKLIGLFMGVLGGLFILGALTTRANSRGAMVGALGGTGVMVYLWTCTSLSFYLYTAAGISACVGLGYIVSLTAVAPSHDLTGLTIHTMKAEGPDSSRTE